MDIDFENIMEFAMDIDKLNLANLEGKVMDKIMEYLVDTLRQLRILPGINEPYWVLSAHFKPYQNLTSRE